MIEMDKTLDQRLFFPAIQIVGPVHVSRESFVAVQTAAAAIVACPTTPAYGQLIDPRPVVVRKPLCSVFVDVSHTYVILPREPMARVDVTSYRNADHTFADPAAIMSFAPAAYIG
jgi:hypothetical protein